MPRFRGVPAAPRRPTTRLHPPPRLLPSESPTPSPSLTPTTLEAGASPSGSDLISDSDLESVSSDEHLPTDASPQHHEDIDSYASVSDEDEMASLPPSISHPSPSPSISTSSSTEHLKEIGNLASWTVSTAKPGCGVEQLRDPDTSLYWQSDGPQPHTISIHFSRRVPVRKIQLYLDHDADESYTPTRISVSSGTGYHDLQEVCMMTLECPVGWVEVPLDGAGEGGVLKTFLVEVKVHANHQNGKDTHVRGLQIFASMSGKGEESVLEGSGTAEVKKKDLQFKNPLALAEMEIR